MDLFDALARGEWSLPTADGAGDLTVVELGTGDPVLVLAGGPGNHFAYMVDAVRHCLDAARWVFLEQRGSLLSPVRAEGLSVDRLITDIESLRGALDLDRLVIFGHSWGSLLAQLYYRAHPDRIRSLILSGAFPPAADLVALDGEVKERQEALMTRPEVAEAVRKAGIDPDADDLHPRDRRTRRMITGTAAFCIWDMTNWARVRPMRFDRDAAIAIDNSLPASYDISPVLAEHPAPITVLQGEHDYVDPHAAAWEALSRTCENVRVEVIPAAVHNPWLDHPRTFDRALRRALSRVRERSVAS